MNRGKRADQAGPGADGLALRLAELFAERGYQFIEPAMLLPADVVIDHMGEDIRRRLLLTVSPEGRELCLRPDFTLPVALAHIERGCASRARYGYSGLAFRFPAATDRLRRSAEFRQVGIEDYGDPETAAADAGALEAALAAVTQAGLADFDVSLGDVGIFAALIDALDLSEVWAARVKRLFWRGMNVADIVAGLDFGSAPGRSESEQGLGQALSGVNPQAAQAVIREVMAIAGAGAAGGREPEEIAARFVEKASAGRDGGPGPEVVRLVEAYLRISGPASTAVAALTGLAKQAGVDLSRPIAALGQRLELIGRNGVDLQEARFATAFGRRIEYYTGHVFEIRARGDDAPGPVAAGGRYDGFLSALGAPEPVMAVGCSIYVDRLAAAVAGRAGP